MTTSLAGIGVVVTRPRDQSVALVEQLRGFGATVVELALTRIVGRSDPWTASERAALALADIVAVTSANGARELARQLVSNGCQLPTGALVAAVGDETADALRGEGIRVDVVPPEATSAAIGAAIVRHAPMHGRRAVLARARHGRPELADGLVAQSIAVSELPLYDTVAREPGQAQVSAALACRIWTFLAPSSVDVAVATVGAAHLASRAVVSIGPTTSAHLRAAGIPVAAEAAVRSADGVAQAVVSAARALRAADDR